MYRPWGKSTLELAHRELKQKNNYLHGQGSLLRGLPLIIPFDYRSLYIFNGPFPASFSLFYVFLIQLTVKVQYKLLPMTGFEPRSSRSDHSTN